MSTSFAVLRSTAEIDAALDTLETRGLMPPSRERRRGRGILRRLIGRQKLEELTRPDPLKSWDVLRTIECIERSVGRSEAVLDLGSFASAIPNALHVLGYTDLKGIDLDPRVQELSRDGIEYTVGDLTATAWADGSFRAVTAISVIEHGVPWHGLFSEVARLLEPGGLFVFSTDYWPEKIDTSDSRLFGLPWTIFSREEIRRFINEARGYGLDPVTDPSPDFGSVASPPIDFAGRRYTFLHGTLEKRA